MYDLDRVEEVVESSLLRVDILEVYPRQSNTKCLNKKFPRFLTAGWI
jgi:hypothetical protein